MKDNGKPAFVSKNPLFKGTRIRWNKEDEKLLYSAYKSIHQEWQKKDLSGKMKITFVVNSSDHNDCVDISAINKDMEVIDAKLPQESINISIHPETTGDLVDVEFITMHAKSIRRDSIYLTKQNAHLLGKYLIKLAEEIIDQTD